MKTIQLTGRLAKEFGTEFKLDISSPAEGVRALCYQLKGFEESLKKGLYRLVKIYKDAESTFDEKGLNLAFGKAIGFKIVPVVAGAAKRGLGKLVLGIVIVGAAFFTAGGAAGLASPALFGGTAAQVTFGNIALAGGMIALQGASALLSPTPETSDTDDTESFLINSAGNVSTQGSAVPLVFGRVFTGSVVISQGISTEDIAV